MRRQEGRRSGSTASLGTFIRSNLPVRVEEEFQPRIFRGGKDRWKGLSREKRLMLALFDSLPV